MLFAFTNVSLTSIKAKVELMSSDQRQNIIKTYVGNRQNRRNRPGRALENGYPYNFDCVINFGVYKDLQRHRMNTQQRQLFTTKIGFYIPEELVKVGVEDKIKACIEKSDAL